MDCSLPGSSIHGIFQARELEWGAFAFSPSQCSHIQFSHLLDVELMLPTPDTSSLASEFLFCLTVSCLQLEWPSHKGIQVMSLLCSKPFHSSPSPLGESVESSSPGVEHYSHTQRKEQEKRKWSLSYPVRLESILPWPLVSSGI